MLRTEGRTLRVSFEEWLADAIVDGESGLYVDDTATVREYIMRLNRTLPQIAAEHGEEAVNRAVWHTFGTGSCYAREVLERSSSDARFDFMASVRDLYAIGFTRLCSDFFGHLDRGPAAARPLNSACYMLWDMGGIECPAIAGDAEALDMALDVLAFALTLENWACQESALHGLGHFAMDCRDGTTPVIEGYLNRRDIPTELRDYARAAISGCVL